MKDLGKFGIIVIFGEDATRKYLEYPWYEFVKHAKEEGLHYAVHDFKTQGELEAYKMAMDECYGWFEYTNVDQKDRRKMLRLIGSINKRDDE